MYRINEPWNDALQILRIK